MGRGAAHGGDLIEVVLFIFMVTVLVMEVDSVLDVIGRVINVLSEERDDGDDDAIKMVHSRKLWTTALSRSSLLGPYYLLERSVPHSVTHGQ